MVVTGNRLPLHCIARTYISIFSPFQDQCINFRCQIITQSDENEFVGKETVASRTWGIVLVDVVPRISTAL